MSVESMTNETTNQESPYQRAAMALHAYLVCAHWTGKALSGPDSGIRFNSRIGRFIKSYLSALTWSDNLAYMQTQGYWILANWKLFDLTGDDELQKISLSCSDNVLANQTSEGYWEYPNREWKGRIATVEGCFAALGLLESYARIGNDAYLASARKWCDYLVSEIGFRRQKDDGMQAINYFAHHTGDGGGVPNNSALALRFFATLSDATDEPRYLEPCGKMTAWLRHVQLPSGELPYFLGAPGEKDTTHFLCFQYNAFELLELAWYRQLTDDDSVLPIIAGLAKYLATGLTGEGKARFDCMRDTPDVLYYTFAVAAALSVADDLQLGPYKTKADQAMRAALSHQRADGGFNYFSRKNYKCLTDRRPYPRNLAMMLFHLLCADDPASPPGRQGGSRFARGAEMQEFRA